MSFILSDQRYDDIVAAFERYGVYLRSVADRFPPSALELASSEWYWNFDDHRCPHDAWLESAVIGEPARGERQETRTVSLTVRLLGAYHDGHIEFVYPRVYRYELALTDGERGHCDWWYDEFRLSPKGHLLHEIEWCGARRTGRWIIEASDAMFRWMPNAP
jgi:hypothetical protein